jgi:hypothetical protein
MTPTPWYVNTPQYAQARVELRPRPAATHDSECEDVGCTEVGYTRDGELRMLVRNSTLVGRDVPWRTDDPLPGFLTGVGRRLERNQITVDQAQEELSMYAEGRPTRRRRLTSAEAKVRLVDLAGRSFGLRDRGDALDVLRDSLGQGRPSFRQVAGKPAAIELARLVIEAGALQRHVAHHLLISGEALSRLLKKPAAGSSKQLGRVFEGTASQLVAIEGAFGPEAYAAVFDQRGRPVLVFAA